MMTAIRVASAALAALIAVSPAAAQNLTIPAVANFEDPEFADYYANIAGGLGGTIVDGKVVVDSQQEEGDASLTHYNLNGDGMRGVFVEVTASFPGVTRNADRSEMLVGPGILVRGEDNATAYYVLLLQSDGYLIMGVANGRITERFSDSLPRDFAARPVKLGARESGNGVEFYVAGKRVATLSGNPSKGRRIGLAVFGSGRFTFDNFGLNRNGDIGSPAP